MRPPGQLLVQVLSLVAIVGPAAAQTTSPSSSAARDPDPPSWEVRASAAVYVLPAEENYAQPTVAADHGNWHLETRYNYEDRDAVSGFLGWNFEFGSSVVLEVTPMLGAVVGNTDGIVPAVIAGLTWKRLEFYVEGEYLIDAHDAADSFAYHWSEASVWITGQIRAGVVTQRTRVYATARDIQRGFLVGVALGRLEGAVYAFNPFDDDDFVVASIGFTF
jgi:hypothetical protein